MQLEFHSWGPGKDKLKLFLSVYLTTELWNLWTMLVLLDIEKLAMQTN